MDNNTLIKKLFVVGIGPGNIEDMTIRAHRILSECDVIAGYTVYCDLVRPFFADKEYLSTPMMGEEKRVRLAFEAAEKGKKVALICSGDAGVYGLAGLAVLAREEFKDVEIEVIPGVTAALSGGALLGAPLIHDFCLISLSDRLTPWEVIEKRLHNAALADMVIVLYNPESKSRVGYLKRACNILMEIYPPDRVCAEVNNIGREKQERHIMTLEQLKEFKADMFSTVFIGNSCSHQCMDFMVTPRGYKSEK